MIDGNRTGSKGRKVMGENRGHDDKWFSGLWMGLGCILMGILLWMGQVQGDRERLAERLAPSVLRFHILANSDSDADQEVKLRVRSLILDYVGELLPEDADKAETAACLSRFQDAIEERANRFLAENGFLYQAHMQLTRCYFPTRVYGELVFPCGTYDAVRVTLGKGEGHNWWCVLYPRFCFADAVCSKVPPESMELLRRNVNQDDFLALEDHRPDIKIGFRLIPGLVLTLPQQSP